MTSLDGERDPLAEKPSVGQTVAEPEPVSGPELNAWRRGLTPQAEIWNGRLAMIGLSVGLSVLLVARLASH
ncbi:MAG: high light inducible protein [Cyanobium sp.]